MEEPQIVTATFMVWVTLLTPSYTDSIVSELIKKGYQVSCASGDGKLTIGKRENPAQILGLRLIPPHRDYKALDIEQDVGNIIFELKAYYYSIIVSLCIDSCWTSSNIEMDLVLPEDKKTKTSIFN